MRSESCLEAIVATLLTGFIAVAAILLGAAPGFAQSLPSLEKCAPRAAKVALTRIDQVAALENLQYALSELGDGASYVWHRHRGQLSGVIQPTMSFRDAKGRICRHLVVLLSAGDKSSKTEAIACRMDNGIWRFDS